MESTKNFDCGTQWGRCDMTPTNETHHLFIEWAMHDGSLCAWLNNVVMYLRGHALDYRSEGPALKFPHVSGLVVCAFVWDQTPEGNRYWARVNHRYKAANFTYDPIKMVRGR